jgi:hypothetical protein
MIGKPVNQPSMKKMITMWWSILSIGVLLLLGAFASVAGTILEMQEVMLDVQPDTDPASLSEGLSQSLMGTYIGMGLGTLGAILVTVSTIGLILSKNKQKRLQRSSS